MNMIGVIQKRSLLERTNANSRTLFLKTKDICL